MHNDIPLESQASSVTPQLDSRFSTTAERFIVFLDIMGFKERVARNPHETVHKQLEGFQNLISGFVSEEKTSNIKMALFSDSVLLFSEEACRASLASISDVAKKIMKSALQLEVPVPLKGAVAKGTVTCDTAKQLYFGQALIDAYMLEENVKYYGVLVHHTAEKDVRELGGNTYRNISAFLRCGRVAHYELNWYAEADNGETSKSFEECLARLRLTVSDEPRKYIDNTLSLYKDTGVC